MKNNIVFTLLKFQDNSSSIFVDIQQKVRSRKCPITYRQIVYMYVYILFYISVCALQCCRQQRYASDFCSFQEQDSKFFFFEIIKVSQYVKNNFRKISCNQGPYIVCITCLIYKIISTRDQSCFVWLPFSFGIFFV